MFWSNVLSMRLNIDIQVLPGMFAFALRVSHHARAHTADNNFAINARVCIERRWQIWLNSSCVCSMHMPFAYCCCRRLFSVFFLLFSSCNFDRFFSLPFCFLWALILLLALAVVVHGVYSLLFKLIHSHFVVLYTMGTTA